MQHFIILLSKLQLIIIRHFHSLFCKSDVLLITVEKKKNNNDDRFTL